MLIISSYDFWEGHWFTFTNKNYKSLQKELNNNDSPLVQALKEKPCSVEAMEEYPELERWEMAWTLFGSCIIIFKTVRDGSFYIEFWNFKMERDGFQNFEMLKSVKQCWAVEGWKNHVF